MTMASASVKSAMYGSPCIHAVSPNRMSVSAIQRRWTFRMKIGLDSDWQSFGSIDEMKTADIAAAFLWFLTKPHIDSYQ
jgi:hypothetical protein